jgi:riboflavin kinase/FMN adenylyltransferase
VHLGHQQLLKQATAIKNVLNLTSMVFTFDYPPEQLFHKELRLITDFKTKQKLLLASGVDQVVWTEFDPEFAAIPAVEFVTDILLGELKAAAVVCGFNYRFGHRAEGNTELLRQLGEQHGFIVEVISPFLHNNQPVSSSRIRKLIGEGNVEQAAELLGRFHSYHGTVVHGKKLGRELGFPTANTKIDPRLVLPQAGAYLTWCFLPDGSSYPAMTSVSPNGTVESYLFEFSGDLYGQTIEVCFLMKMRSWKEFSSIQSLKEQLSRDYEYAAAHIDNYRLQGQRIVLE